MHRFFNFIVIFLLILGDIFLFAESSDLRMLGILLLYFIFIKRLHFKSKMTFILSLLLLVLAYIQFVFTDPAVFSNPGVLPLVAEKTAVWAFLLLVVGLIQKWKE